MSSSYPRSVRYTHQANMSINRLNSTIGVRYEEFGVNKLLDSKYNAIFAL